MSDDPGSHSWGVDWEGTLDGIAPPHVLRSTQQVNNGNTNTDVGTARVGTSVLALGPSDVGSPSPAAGLPGEDRNTAGKLRRENVLRPVRK